jgi:hypothetical protein
MNHYRTIFALTFTLLATILNAQEPDSLKKKRKHFELSFGQSVLFISSSKQIDIRNESAIVVPTSSVLFLVGLRPHKIVRIPIFFNLPTESKQFLINGQLVNEKASPTFGTGLQFKLFQIKIDSKSKIDFEAGPLASFIFDKGGNIRIAPVAAGRIRIMRGENFVMYFGTSYSIGINALGLLYGTGTIF